MKDEFDYLFSLTVPFRYEVSVIFSSVKLKSRIFQKHVSLFKKLSPSVFYYLHVIQMNKKIITYIYIKRTSVFPETNKTNVLCCFRVTNCFRGNDSYDIL